MGDGQHPRVLVVLDGTEEADVTVAPLRATPPGAQDLVLLALVPARCTDHVFERTRRQPRTPRGVSYCRDAASKGASRRALGGDRRRHISGIQSLAAWNERCVVCWLPGGDS